MHPPDYVPLALWLPYFRDQINPRFTWTSVHVWERSPASRPAVPLEEFEPRWRHILDNARDWVNVYASLVEHHALVLELDWGRYQGDSPRSADWRACFMPSVSYDLLAV